MEVKKNQFILEVQNLINSAKEIYSFRYEADYVHENLACLNKFESIFNNPKSSKSAFMRYFLSIYRKYENEISFNSDLWLKSNEIIVQFGEGEELSEEKKAKAAKVRFNLQYFYDLALKLSEETKQKAVGSNEKFFNAKLFTIDKFFLYYLFKIFYLSIEDDKTKEKEKLASDITSFEVLLKIKTEKKEAGGAPGAGITGTIFNMAKGVMKSAGIDVPDMPMPSEDKMSGILERVIGAPGTQNMFTGLFSMLNPETTATKLDPDNLNESVTSIINTVLQPENVNNIKETFEQITKEQAL